MLKFSLELGYFARFFSLFLVLLGQREEDFGSTQLYALGEEVPLWQTWWHVGCRVG